MMTQTMFLTTAICVAQAAATVQATSMNPLAQIAAAMAEAVVVVGIVEEMAVALAAVIKADALT